MHPPALTRRLAFSTLPAAPALSRTSGVADLTTMCEAIRVAYRRVNKNGRGGRFLDYTMVAGNVLVTTVVVLAAAGVKLPGI